MSGSPVVRVTVASPVPVIRVAAPTMPAVVRVQSLGTQGPPGQQGLPGYAKRFGTIDYTDNDAVLLDGNGDMIGGTPLSLPAGEWIRITRNLTPSAANFNLPSGPWTNFAFWDNTAGVLRARAVGDVLLFKFSYTVVPAQREGACGSRSGPPTTSASSSAPTPSLWSRTPIRRSPARKTFVEQCRSRFVNAGAVIYVMATSGATLTEFSLR